MWTGGLIVAGESNASLQMHWRCEVATRVLGARIGEISRCGTSRVEG